MHTEAAVNPAHARASRWPERYKLVALSVIAAFICYIDRVNISVAVIAMQEQYAWSETQKGLVLSSFFVGYMLFMAPAGWLANRYGGKVILGIAVFWWSLWTVLTPVAASLSFTALIAARILMGLGESAMFPAVYNLYGRWVPIAERSRAVALLIGGIPLGTMFAVLSTGWIVGTHGWPTVFYAFGSLGVLWTAIWFRTAYNSPGEHPRISREELALLEADAGTATDTTRDKPPVPWRQILSSSAVWALIINHFCSNWVFYMLLAWLPSYFKTQLNISISTAGIYAAGPWLAMLVGGILGGLFADRLVKRGVDLTLVRKGMQIAALTGTATCMLLARDIHSPGMALGLMCGALGLLSLSWSGFLPNHLEIAPRHADILMGLTNTAGTVPGIVGIAITGWLVDVSGTYTTAFALAAGVNLFGAVVWLFFGTARRVID
jgi:ACS family sodium-dependent inorganic phosphate cotransporter